MILCAKNKEVAMSLTLSSALQLEHMDQLKELTNGMHLQQVISAIGILDHEIIEDEYHLFEPGEFVITTFSVARNDVSLVFRAVKGLIKARCSGLAIKSVYYENLPQEIIDYANQHRFAIFIFEDVFIEHLINSVNNAFSMNYEHLITEAKLESLYKGNMNRHMSRHLLTELLHSLKDYIRFYYLKDKQFVDESVMMSRVNYLGKDKESGTGVFLFRKGLLCIFTDDQEMKDDHAFNYLLRRLGVSADDCYVGVSNSHRMSDDMQEGLSEAYVAYQTAEIQNESRLAYQEAGIYRLIVPILRESGTRKYAQSVLEKVIEYDAHYDSHLYDTMRMYLTCACNTKKTAEALFQHKNTVLYRVKKVKKMLGPFESDQAFIEEVSLAIKIYEATMDLR